MGSRLSTGGFQEGGLGGQSFGDLGRIWAIRARRSESGQAEDGWKAEGVLPLGGD